MTRPAPAASPEWVSTYDLGVWDQFEEWCSRPTVTLPESLTRSEYNKLDDDARAAWRTARDQAHRDFPFVDTRDVASLANIVTNVVNNNRGNNSQGAALVVLVDGPTHAGKTTATRRVASDVHREYRRRGHNGVPVVLVEAVKSQKSMAIAMARYLGVLSDREEANPSRLTLDMLVPRIVNTCRRSGVHLFVVDEVQRLDANSANGRDAADLIKTLMNQLPHTTFLLVGADLGQQGPLVGHAAQQVMGRAQEVRLDRWDYGTEKGRERWVRLVTSVEENLRLLDHPTGSLAVHATWLWDNTDGRVGALVNLVRQAAENVAGTDSERLTKAALEAVTAPADVKDYAVVHEQARHEQAKAARSAKAPEISTAA